MNAPAAGLMRFRPLLLIGRGVWIELFRRKDLAVLLILMGLYVLGVWVVRLVGIKNPSTATFLLNLGMTLAYFCAHVLTLLIAARQLPDEIENRTLYPLLARPVERHTVIVGKWLACVACGAATLLLLFLLGWIPVPKMESYHGVMLIQTLVLHVASLSVLAALAMALSLLVPRGVNLVLLALWFVVGRNVLGFLTARFEEAGLKEIALWFSAYLPDFSKLNLITRYTDGIAPLAGGSFLGLLLYGAVFSAVALLLAAYVFRRRPL